MTQFVNLWVRLYFAKYGVWPTPSRSEIKSLSVLKRVSKFTDSEIESMIRFLFSDKWDYMGVRLRAMAPRISILVLERDWIRSQVRGNYDRRRKGIIDYNKLHEEAYDETSDDRGAGAGGDSPEVLGSKPLKSCIKSERAGKTLRVCFFPDPE